MNPKASSGLKIPHQAERYLTNNLILRSLLALRRFTDKVLRSFLVLRSS
ncbi:hypothetical protein ACFL56_02960 [Candidatus Margulisiibacteriota bacterium]